MAVHPPPPHQQESHLSIEGPPAFSTDILHGICSRVLMRSVVWQWEHGLMDRWSEYVDELVRITWNTTSLEGNTSIQRPKFDLLAN